MATNSRLEPLPVERWGDEERAALAAGFPELVPVFLSGEPDAPPMPNVLATVMHNPAIAGRFFAHTRVLLESPSLGHRWRELVILRVTWRTRLVYEWVQHLSFAAAAGITKDEIEAIARGDYAGRLAELEVALLDATDQLLDRYRIEDETWARLAAQLDAHQLVELPFTVGTYACAAMAFNSFGLQLDPGTVPDPALPTPDPEGDRRFT